MNSAFSPQRRLTLVDLIAVVLAAGLSALAFHPQCLAPIEWIGLFPFLKVLRGKTIKQGAVLGFLFGVVFHGILNWYIAVTVFRARVWFPYQLWQAVLVAGSAWVGALLICSFWSMLFGISHAALGALSARAGVSACGPFAIATLWSIVEYLRSLGPFGYTWGDLGYSQVPCIPVLQIASLTGIYGLSFLIAWVNAAIVSVSPHGSLKSWKPLIAPIAATLVAAVIAGSARELYHESGAKSTPVKVRLVQPDYPNDVKLDQASYGRNVADQCALSCSKIERVDLILWAETAIPEPLFHRPATMRQLEAVARITRAELVVGAIDLDDPGRQYNAAFAISPEGRVWGVYRKRHLVPFGEYVPMRTHWRFMKFFAFRDPDFSPGQSRRLLPSPVGPLGVAICFESTFPEIARELTRGGAAVLGVLTNDEWMTGTAAPVLHFDAARMRAVENRRFVLRATNSGISGVIDPEGRIEGSLQVGRRGVLDLQMEGRSGSSAYSIIGEWWMLACVLLSLGPVVLHAGSKRISEGKP